MARKRAPSSRIQQLRAEVAKAERLTQAKLRRIQKSQGIRDVTNIDPRMAPGMRIARRDPSKYNQRQLQAYLATLNAFRDRKVQFVADARGRAISRTAFQRYKALEAQYRQTEQEHFKTISGLYAPWAGQTLGERMRNWVPEQGFRGTNPAANTPYNSVVRSSRMFDSEKALAKITASYERRINPEYREEMLRRGMESSMKMLEDINDPALMSKIRELTPAQWDLVWNYTSLPNALSTIYEHARARLEGKPEERDWSTVDRNEAAMVDEIIAWAKSIDLG